MNKTWTLLKANLSNAYGLGRIMKLYKRKKAVKPSSIAVPILVLIVLAAIIGFLGMYYALIGMALNQAGELRALLTVVAIAACVPPFFVSIYKSPGSLYASKDYNLLTALPVSPGAVLASKILSLYVSSLLMCLAIAGPGAVVYGILAKESAAFYFAAFGMLLFLPLAPMTLGTLLAFPIMFIGSKFRYSNVIVLILYFALVVAIVVGNLFITPESGEMMAAGVMSVAGIADFYPPAAQFSSALTGGGIVPGLALIALNIAVFMAFIIIFAGAYSKINAALGERHSRSNFKLGKVSVSGQLPALFGKEFKGVFSFYAYIINTGIGMALYTVYNVAVMFMGYESVAQMLEFPGGDSFYLSMSALIGGFCVAMSTISAPSISVEGQSIWILKSLPVRFWDIAKAKALTCFSITAPLSLINCILISITSGADILMCVGMTLALLAFCAFTAPLGLIMNLYLPKLGWTNIIHAVKQSASVFFTMIIGAVVVGLEALMAYLTGMPQTMFFFIAVGINIVLSALAFSFLYTKGQGLFDRL